jgi:hypothetical protein
MAGSTGIASAQVNCEAIPAGPGRTDCYIGLSRINRDKSKIAARRCAAAERCRDLSQRDRQAPRNKGASRAARGRRTRTGRSAGLVERKPKANPASSAEPDADRREPLERKATYSARLPFLPSAKPWRACWTAFAEDGTKPSASVVMRSGPVRGNHDLVASSRTQTDKSQYPSRIPEVAHANGQHRGRDQSRVAWKVSQLATSPDFSPVMNQRVRCSDEPWVKASGTT